ncbi:MAG: hypothetical protein CSA42_05910 [Gammaproteobacteria bacterium]|nr:MAG: hypothetical protein CSA42_05910 [Gammaproteobacteria bacterium]
MKKLNLFIVVLSVLSFTGCIGPGGETWATKAWNGYYGMAKIKKEIAKEHEEFLQRQKVYYENEAPEIKALRAKNEKICKDMAYAKFPSTDPDAEDKIFNATFQDRMRFRVKCQEERGTPFYATIEKK